jgi:hypothetical protein
MNYTDIFIFVIASFGDPVYYDMIKMRKLQLQKYGISNMFVFDGPFPNDYTPDQNDVCYTPPQEPFPVDFTVPYRSINPHMIIKFLKAIKTVDLSKYKFIARINLSTFVNFPLLLNKLQQTPTSRVCLSPDGGIYKTLDFVYNMIHEDYKKSCCESHKPLHTESKLLIERYYKEKPTGPLCCDLMNDMKHFSKTEYYLTPTIRILSGTIHIYSVDFVNYLKENIELDNPNLYVHNDDLVLSFFVQKYGCQYIPLQINNTRDDLNNKMIVRIKHTHNRQIDVAVWRHLLKTVDNITYN